MQVKLSSASVPIGQKLIGEGLGEGLIVSLLLQSLMLSMERLSNKKKEIFV